MIIYPFDINLKGRSLGNVGSMDVSVMNKPFSFKNSPPSITVYAHLADLFKKVCYQSGNTVYAISQGSDPTIIYKSTDLGKTWSEQGQITGAIIQYLYKIQNSGTLIAIDQHAKIWRSTDDGANWTTTFTMNYLPIEQCGITETANGNILVGEYGSDTNVNYNIYLSTDDGQNWTVALSSRSVETAANPGHIHCVAYDRYTDKVVAFFDYNVPEIWVSEDNGVSWSKIGNADDPDDPNFVQPMFFENYVAWHYDTHANEGWIARLPRDDFYAGNWDNVEKVARVNEKMGYYALEIKDGYYLISFDVTSTGYIGNFAEEVFIVYDNGEKVIGGFRHILQNVFLVEDSAKVRFPSTPYNSPLSGKTLVNLSQKEAPKGFSAVPISLDFSYAMPTIYNGPTGFLFLPKGSQIRWRTDEGEMEGGVKWDDTNNRLILENTAASTIPEIRLFEDGSTGILRGGSLLAWYRTDELRLYKDLAMQAGTVITTSSGNLTLSPAGGEVEWIPIWQEQRAHITQFYKPGTNYPAQGEIGVTPVLLFDATNDEWVYYEWEVPENYHAGSDFKIRFYWAPTDSNTGDVIWGIEYNVISPENDEVLTATTTTQTVTDSAQGLANELLRTDFITISGTEIQPGDIISMRVYRDADADDYGADAALVHLGIYFQIDRNGIASP